MACRSYIKMQLSCDNGQELNHGIMPRGGQGSRSICCHMAMEEPLSFQPTHRLNNARSSNHQQRLRNRTMFNCYGFDTA